MELQHLTSNEASAVTNFTRTRQITIAHLPFGQGGSIFFDSMGVWRDAGTDRLFPGSADTIRAISPMFRANGIAFGTATAGPAREGVDILKCLDYPVPGAIAVTEGGGIVLLASPSGNLMPKAIASRAQLAHLKTIEAQAKKDPLMKFLLEDETEDDAPPIRTPYGYKDPKDSSQDLEATNIVITLPPTLEILERRLTGTGINLAKTIPGFNPSKYVSDILGYSQRHYLRIIGDLGLQKKALTQIKDQNRRVYLSAALTDLSGIDLSKSGGARESSVSPIRVGGVAMLRDYPTEYRIEDSIYIADKALIPDRDGQLVINGSERSMIVNSSLLVAGPHRFVNFLHQEPVYRLKPGFLPSDFEYDHASASELVPHTVYADVSCRLAVDVTLDDSPPTLVRVEGVPFLRIGTGAKAAEALALLYEEVYGRAA